MNLEHIKIIKPPGTKLTVRMIQYYLSCWTSLSFLHMNEQLVIRIQFLLAYHASAVVQANITQLIQIYQT